MSQGTESDRERIEVRHALSWPTVFGLAAALVLGLGTLRLFAAIAIPIALLTLGITIAAGLEPLVAGLERRGGKRAMAIAVVYVVLALLAGGLGWLIAPAVADQARALAEQAPAMIETARARLVRAGLLNDQGMQGISEILISRAGGLAFRIPEVVLRGLSQGGVVIFLSVYWLLASPSVKQFTLSLVPGERRPRARRVVADMGHAMGGYLRGTVISAVVMGLLAWAGLSLLGIEYPLALAALTMAAEFIPILGPILAGVLVTGVALLDSLTTAAMAAGLYLLLQQIESHFLTPNVMRSQTELPQALVLFAVVAGAATGKIIWVLVAVPVAAAARVLVLEVIAPAERRWAEDPDAEDAP